MEQRTETWRLTVKQADGRPLLTLFVESDHARAAVHALELLQLARQAGPSHANPVAQLDRPPHGPEGPRQVPGPVIMDALIEAAKRRKRPRDLTIFLILRYTGMRRESVATLRVRHLDGQWGLRRVRVKGGKTRDIPLPAAVMQFLHEYVERVLMSHGETVGPDTPLFWLRVAAHREHPDRSNVNARISAT